MRRRWITLGEVLTVIAVTISGLTLWNNWSQRTDSESARSASDARASARAGTLMLLSDGANRQRLTLHPASPDQAVQSQRIVFPAALGLPAAQTTGEPRIETDWFDAALKKARAAAKLPDNSRGDETLPVLVSTRFVVDGAPHTDTALYDLGYTIEGHWLGGHTITLSGISLVRHGAGQAALDARWKTLLTREGQPGS
ncbi:hypothetical protein MTR62_16350 [Novosphingobium sp. 1949]|uniref:Type II secretion system protein GspJ n=1 Tax=Novosphingobium organovorum TaxID=2930092 RepID=A0ABT0BGT8_9SPHN|nr:hypothetical protein [Novosphingobium organovorum]